MGKRPATTNDGRPAGEGRTPYTALFCLLATLFALAAVMTFSAADWPNPHVFPHSDPAHNACGRVGAWTAYHIMRLIGAGIYPILFFAVIASFLTIARGPIDQMVQRVGGVLCIAIVTSSAVNLLRPEGGIYLPGGYAGALGVLFGTLLRENFSGFGTFLILAYCTLASSLFIIDGLWARTARLSALLLRAGRGALGGLVALGAGATSVLVRLFKRPAFAGDTAAPSRSGPITLKLKLNHRHAGAMTSPADEAAQPAASTRAGVEMPGARPADVAPKSAAPSAPKIRQLTFRANRPEPSETTGCYPATLDDWVLPPIALLEEIEYAFAAQQETHARQMAKTLEDTLHDFKLEGPVVEIETGPVITMFQLKLAPGIKVSQIMALSNDLARALRAPAVRVVATIPGKNTIGIEVPRLDREKVRLKELMTIAGKHAQEMALPLFLGKDASGNCMVYDLTRMPHLLIAGTTGSGKSVCINSIIMSLLMTQRPDRVKMILIDPKMVELSSFKEVPHLMCPIVTDVQKAEQVLEWACTKMDERYGLLAEAQARNIAGYNRLTRNELYERFLPVDDAEKAQIPTYLPYIVIVIDELADMMMTSGKEVEFHLARLAQKSRAVGIHIVVATQRPEAKVLTGLIKSNMPCRCAFRVAARLDSRIVLDQNGAEVLLGQGDMLFLPPGSANLMRAQGTYIEDAEIRGVINDLRGKGRCEFHPELVQLRASAAEDDGERDELFDQAVRLILESQRGSVSLLQRRLTVGYSRASRLIDQMAGAGIVGEYKGSQAREVLMSLEEWDGLKAEAQENPAPDEPAEENATTEFPRDSRRHASSFDD